LAQSNDDANPPSSPLKTYITRSHIFNQNSNNTTNIKILS